MIVPTNVPEGKSVPLFNENVDIETFNTTEDEEEDVAICKPPNLGNTESLYLGTDHYKSISLKYRAWSTEITQNYFPGSLEIASSAIVRILER
jgi:hypothetical protein